jgi:hypothetical protein
VVVVAPDSLGQRLQCPPVDQEAVAQGWHQASLVMRFSIPVAVVVVREAAELQDWEAQAAAAMASQPALVSMAMLELAAAVVEEAKTAVTEDREWLSSPGVHTWR